MVVAEVMVFRFKKSTLKCKIWSWSIVTDTISFENNQYKQNFYISASADIVIMKMVFILRPGHKKYIRLQTTVLLNILALHFLYYIHFI